MVGPVLVKLNGALGIPMKVIEISCLEVWREISNYLDGEVDAELRSRMEAHFKTCAHCKAVLDGTRNVVKLVGDGIEYQVPEGFSKRLYDKIMNK
jgi:anti-sigma factor (TIGR02949 family)